MAARASNQREMQEQSIKARKHELFVEEEHVVAGPRKQFREYLRETPAAPLSKNVKMILWGSAAPVAFLFLGALLTAKGTSAKPPEFVIPVNRVPSQSSAAPAPVKHKHGSAPAPQAVASNEAAPEASVTNPPEEKPKPVAKKKKGKGRGKGKKKDQPKTEVAKAEESARKAEAGATGDNEPAKAEEPAGSKAGEMANAEKPGAEKAPDSKAETPATAKAPEPEPKPEKKKVSVFKKKKPPVFTYPKATRDDDKKNETNK